MVGRRPPRVLKNKKSIIYLLEKGTEASILRAKAATDNLIEYHWRFYSELAQQRKLFRDELLSALRKASKSNFQIESWQRSIKYKHSNHPLSTVGSIVNNGGRFNTGSGVNPVVQPLHAFYLAKDKDTALQEQLGQEVPENSPLSAQEIALTSKASISTLCLSGHINSYIDLTTNDHLDEFVSIIKKFTISKALHKESLKINQQPPAVVKTKQMLLKSLLESNWKIIPSQFDIPANSQIFGQLVCDAGIQAILYPSKLTKKPCLAIFLQNFEGSEGYIQLDDESPEGVIVTKITSQNWKLSQFTYGELRQFKE